MRFIQATILTSVSPSLSTWSQSVGSSWLSFWPGFVTSFNRQPEELTYIPMPLLTVNLWGLLIQTRKGRGNWSYLSPLSGRPHDTWLRIITGETEINQGYFFFSNWKLILKRMLKQRQNTMAIVLIYLILLTRWWSFKRITDEDLWLIWKIRFVFIFYLLSTNSYILLPPMRLY